MDRYRAGVSKSVDPGFPADGAADSVGSSSLFADASAGEQHAGSTRVRHQAVTRQDLLGVVVIAFVAAAAAVTLSSAAPTNTGWIDAVERGLAVGAVAIAGSKARRWALVLGSVLVSIAAPWPLLVLGLIALATNVFLVETRTRSRVLGAAVGAVVALLALGLSLPGPTGLETLVGLVATVPVVVSGYRRSSRAVRRSVRRGVWVLLAVLAVGTVISGIAAATSVGDMDRAIAKAQQAVDAAEEGSGGDSAALFEQANESFVSANTKIGSMWASGPRLIPAVGANLAAVQRSVQAGERLSEAGVSLVSGAEFSNVQLDDGGVDLVELEALTPRVLHASDVLQDAQRRIEEAGSVWLLGPLADRLGEVDDRLADTAGNADNAAVAVEGLPAMLGADGPRRYLFLFGNPAESRDMGGHIGNWAEVVADDGQIDLVDVGGPLDLSVPQAANELADGFPASFVTMDPARFPQNLGATPDLGVTADYAAELYERRFSRRIDGVVYADVEAFAALVSLVGPVEVPGLAGFELTAENAVQFVTVDQYTAFDTEEASGEALESVIRTVFDRLTTTRLAGPDRLGELFAPLVDTGRFQVASLQPSDGEMLRYFDLDGAVPEPAGRDVLGVFNRNAGPSKIDSFLQRDVSVDINWDARTGGTSSAVVVELTNTAPQGGINSVIGGSKAAVAPGTNVTDVVVLTPFRVNSVLVDSLEHAAQPLLEGDLWRHTVRVGVPPGETVTVRFDLRGEVEPGPTYQLSYVGQPLLNSRSSLVTMRPSAGKVSAIRTVGARSTGSTVEIPQDQDARVTWNVDSGSSN